ncbi:GNAT family N-acetyltransferase [Salininema proteolyticum]|uniref:GNAT family N-acetyltransferase n=1 Tax=Salininema proteolyticum TaxID=1607685 RepID=A0ABV8TUI7_9ACTN
MPELIVPSPAVKDSFWTAVEEYAAAGMGESPSTFSAIEIVWLYRELGAGDRLFEQHLARMEAEAAGDRPLRTYWWVEDGEFIGRLTLRLGLPMGERLKGGDVGYDVRPSRRGEGHATAMLSTCLVLARREGLEELYVNCEPSNKASRSVIRRNGGETVKLPHPRGRTEDGYLCHRIGL